ncbi:Hypothetical protein, putative [Bodo saltans]|uniref:Uncharacterized protein n=1 Tax=Bodo saltans TaxID=75058 RepID=A0A0S4JG72_BODSA|nr:Hypothetical protein, putative [Bodo saltans]|eukprot:CUG89111.1 Hypothetical protein, putative [Bodo saltans]
MTEGPQFAVTSSSAPPPQQQNFFFVLDPRDFRVSTHRQTTRGAFATATRTASVATHSVEEDYDGGRAENRLHSHHSAAADRPTTALLRFGARKPNSPSPNRAPSPTSTTAPQRSSGAVPSSDRNEKPPFSAGGVIRYEDDNIFLDDGTAWRRPHQNTSHASTAGAPPRRAVSPSPELTVRVDHQNLNTAVKDNSFHPVVNQKSKAMDVAAQQRRLLLIDETEVTTTVHQSLGASHLSSRSTSAQRQIRIPTSSQAVDARSTSPQARTTTRGAAAAGYHTTVAAGDDVDDIVASPPPRWLVLHRMAEVLQSKKQLAAEEHAAEEALQVEREVAAMKHEQRMLANRRLRSNSTGGAAVSNGSAAITPRVRASKVVHSTAPSSTSTSRHHVEHDTTTEHCYSETTLRSSSAADQGVTSNSGAIVFKRKVAPELEPLIAAARSRSSGVKSTTSDVAAAESVSANSARSKFVQQLSASSSNSLRDEVLRDAPSRSGDDSDDNHADTPPPRAEVSAPPMPSPSLHQRRPAPASSPRGSDDQNKKQLPQFTREEYVLPEYSFHPTITRGPKQEYYEQRGLVSATQTTNNGTKSAEEDVPRQEQQQLTTAASNLTSEEQPQPTTTHAQEEHQTSGSRDVVHVMPVAAAVSPSYEALDVEVSTTTPPPVLSPTPHIVDEGRGIPSNEVSEDIVTTSTTEGAQLLPPVTESTPHQQIRGGASVRHREDVRHEPFGDDDGDDVSTRGSSPPTINDTVVVTSGSAASENAIAPPPPPISNIMHNESGRLYNDEEEELLPSPVPELFEETASNGGDDAADAIHGVSHERSPPPPPPVAAETPRTNDEEISEVVFSPRSAMEAILREGEAALEEYEKQHPHPTPPPSGVTTMEDVSNTGKASAAVEPTLRTPVGRRRGEDEHLTEIPTILRDPQSSAVHSPPLVRTPSPVIMVAVAATSSSHVVAAAAAASAQSPPPHSRNTAQQHQQHMYRIDSTDDCDDDLVVYQQTGQHHSVYQSNLYRGATVIAATSAVSIQNTLPTTIAGRPSGGVDTTPVDAGRGKKKS